MLQDLIQEPSPSDRILVLTEKTWTDYERLISDDSNYRISYLNNVINIVSPSRNHERIAAIITILINAYCRKYQIPYFALGSADIKKQFVVGKQPDASYCFQTEKAKQGGLCGWKRSRPGSLFHTRGGGFPP